jgi:predicted metal-binding membrane protein
MAAMMLPSVAPTVALYSRMVRDRSGLLSFMFVGGYLLTWAAAGVAAFAVGAGGSAVAGTSLEWDHAGRVLAGLTLLVAAGYQLSPLKDVCLGKCRSPLGMLLGSWRDGQLGALRMGMKNGAWCVGCCWALMASLFALGVMSVLWMAVVAGLIAIEKTLPWERAATYGTAIVMLALGITVLAAPSAIPGLTIPHSAGMLPMGS